MFQVGAGNMLLVWVDGRCLCTRLAFKWVENAPKKVNIALSAFLWQIGHITSYFVADRNEKFTMLRIELRTKLRKFVFS